MKLHVSAYNGHRQVSTTIKKSLYGKVIYMNQLDATDLLIHKISSTCFGQYFAHHQERETEIFTAYDILLLWWALPLTDYLPTTTTGYHML